MTSDEIQSIVKMQHSATHGNDPYVDDYYHQAQLAKKAAVTRSTRRFCPNKEQSSRSRHSTMQPHLHVDAQGQVSFSSIRRPCRLLEFDPPGLVSSDGSGEQVSEKPLEQEPTLAARITIEDGFYLLLEVDDIDRLLQFSHPQDGGAQLRRKRQILLKGMATSLQLVDPLGKSGNSVGLAPKDDIVFLWLVLLPKGQKLISREAAEAITNLAKTVAGCISCMDLNSLSACVAAIVCSSEQPPLRPLGSPAGDGASVILKSVFERATHLLTDPQAGGSFSMPNPALWQASFDAFLGLLTKYCLCKYDSIVQSILSETPSNTEVIDSEVARAASREMRVELLRVSLLQTNEQQRKLLFNFAQRSMPVVGVNAHGGCSGQTNLEPVSC
ncbi:putative serine/threonine-protein phosphatase 7 long form -like protein [Capsicum annuum]|nr:putative serine/threonine-protein phosphatase 7 long form -like protein [Capsicum annuum]